MLVAFPCAFCTVWQHNMASQGSARLPVEFLVAPNWTVMDTEFYVDELQSYLDAVEADKFTETRRVANVENIVSFQTRKLLKASSAVISKVEDIYASHRKLFPSSHSYTLAREKLNSRFQKDEESVMEYLSEIFNLST